MEAGSPEESSRLADLLLALVICNISQIIQGLQR